MQIKYQKQIAQLFIAIGFLIFAGYSYAEDSSAVQTLRAGFYASAFPDLSGEDLDITVKQLSEEIGKEVGIETKVTVFYDLGLMRKAFEKEDINFVFASALNLANDFDNKLFADGFRAITSNELADTLVVMTRKNEGLDNFAAVQGKRLALVEYNPVAELYMDFLSLSTFKKPYKLSFDKISREKKSQHIILKLFFGQADVACVYQYAFELAGELNPQLFEKLQIISQIKGIPQGIGFFHQNTPAAFRESVISEFLRLDTHAKGQELLQLLKLNKTVRARPEDLAVIKKLYEDYRELKNTR